VSKKETGCLLPEIVAAWLKNPGFAYDVRHDAARRSLL